MASAAAKISIWRWRHQLSESSMKERKGVKIPSGIASMAKKYQAKADNQ